MIKLMMARISRLFLSAYVAAMVFPGCTGETPKIAHKCQLLVVLDKTNSVSYGKKLPYVQSELARNFNQTYATSTKGIESSLLVVTGKTGVFPEVNRFESDLRDGEEDSREYQQQLHQWNTDKRKWLSERVKEAVARIDSPCRSNTTDIFSIFSGIAQVQKNDGPWDSVVVIIFSDMVNTCGLVNLESHKVTVDNARDSGRAICNDLIGRREITDSGNENIYLKIYTPDNVPNTAVINQFWTGFFERWGLKPNQYRFEQ